jgi:hypothetical protein
MPAIKAISVQLDRFAAMQHACEQALPPQLKGRLRVARGEGETVVLEADNGSVAAKARYLQPRLLRALQARFKVSEIRIEVGVLRRTNAHEASARRLAPTGRAAFTALAGSLPAGPLKTAVERVAQAASHREDEALERHKQQGDAGDQQ